MAKVDSDEKILNAEAGMWKTPELSESALIDLLGAERLNIERLAREYVSSTPCFCTDKICWRCLFEYNLRHMDAIKGT